MENLPERELMRVDEVARYFSVTKATVYNWVSSGRLEAVKVAGHILRIPRKSVQNVQKSPFE